MSNIAQQLVDLNTVKSNIKTSIIAKGISVSASDAFNTYPSKIDAITGGGATNSETFHIGTGMSGTGLNSLAIDSSNYIYAGGAFTTYNETTPGNFVRIKPDGTRDTTYDTSTGVDSTVNCLALDSSGKLYVGGAFTTFFGLTQKGLIKLNQDGTKDTTFDVSNGFAGSSAMINCIALDSSENIYVGGSFTSYKGLNQYALVKLKPDGTKDTTFDMSVGFASYVIIYSLVVDSSNYIYVGGSFTAYKGSPAKYLVKIKPDGTKDTTFDTQTKVNGIVNCLLLDSSGKLYTGGYFSIYNGISQNYLVKLNPDVTKDTTFDISSGFNNAVKSIVFDSSGNIYAGGIFTTYQKKYFISGIARILPNGTSDTIPF